MANPLFQDQMKQSIDNQYNSFLSNPIAFLNQRRVSIPQQYMNNSDDAIQYLLNNGIMSQEQYNQIMQYGSMFGFTR